jgi:hypothetical protein
MPIASANAYLDAYRQYDLDQSRAEVSATRQFIEGQLAVAGPRLDSFERTLQEFKTSHGLADLDAETKRIQEGHMANIKVQSSNIGETLSGGLQLFALPSELAWPRTDPCLDRSRIVGMRRMPTIGPIGLQLIVKGTRLLRLAEEGGELLARRRLGGLGLWWGGLYWIRKQSDIYGL